MTLNNFKSHIRNELRPETDVKSSYLVVSNLELILPCLDMAKAYAYLCHQSFSEYDEHPFMWISHRFCGISSPPSYPLAYFSNDLM